MTFFCFSRFPQPQIGISWKPEKQIHKKCPALRFPKVFFMGVSKNRGWAPQIIHLFIGFSLIIKPSIMGYHYFWKHPDVLFPFGWTADSCDTSLWSHYGHHARLFLSLVCQTARHESNQTLKKQDWPWWKHIYDNIGFPWKSCTEWLGMGIW